MNDGHIQALVSEIQNVDGPEFWWDSKLLQRCSKVKEPRVVQSLLIRHHCLTNKEADSAHVIRNTIKIMEGPDFATLWEIIDAESDTAALIEGSDNPFSLPWAAAYVLGEVGGALALSETTKRLSPVHIPRHFLTAKIAFHLTLRYLRVQFEGEPTVMRIDIETEEMTEVPARECPDPVIYERAMLRRRQANEYFVPVSPMVIRCLKSHLSAISEDFIPISKQELFQYIDAIPTQEERGN